MFERLREKTTKAVAACMSHRTLYGGLCACHGWAAWETQKPEVYVPILALYAVLAWRG